MLCPISSLSLQKDGGMMPMKLYIFNQMFLLNTHSQGRIQEFWLGGGRGFFSKAWGFGAALRRLKGAQGAMSPEAPEF